MIKKIILMLLILSIFIIPTQAETFEETYSEESYTLTRIDSSGGATYTPGITRTGLKLDFPNTITNYAGLYFITYTGSGIFITTNGENIDISNLPILIDGYDAEFNYEPKFNSFGTYIGCDIWINILDYDEITSLSSSSISISFPAQYSINSIGKTHYSQPTLSYSGDIPQHYCLFKGDSYWFAFDYIQVVCRPVWKNTISGNYGELISSISLDRFNFASNFSLYDLEDNLLYNSNYMNDVDYSFYERFFKYKIISPSLTEYTKEFIGEGEYDYNLYLTKSKDTELTLNEEINYNLYGINSLLNINTLMWHTYKVDREDFVIGKYHKGTTYEKINDTHWNKFSVYNDDNFESSIIVSEDLTLADVNTEYNRMTNSYNRSGTYKTIVSAYKEDIGGNHILLGTTNTSVNVGAGSSFLVQNTFNTFDASTGNALSGSFFELYGVNSDSLEFITSKNLTGSFTTENLKYGMIYKYYIYKAGYATAQNTFTALTGDTHNIYLNPVTTGYTSLNFLITDSEYNRLQYASVNVNGNIKFTNKAGLVSFTGLALNTTYEYNVSCTDYVSQSGDIYADEVSEQINVYLLKESVVYPSPTPTSPLPENPSDFNPVQTFIYCIMLLGCNYETASLILGCAIVFMAFGMGANTIGLFGGIFAGCIGLVMAIGLALLPFYLFYIFILCASLIIAYRLKP